MKLIIFIILIINTVISFTTTHRPSPADRKFNSTIIESIISKAKLLIFDPILSQTFENCFPNTLDTTVEYSIDNETNLPDTFVITGDIPAMWLRDSTNQVFPYIQFAEKDEKLMNLLKGVINRQKKNILIDAYPNAFNKIPFDSPYMEDETTKLVDGKPVNAMNKMIWERKFEIDSVAAVLKLATEFYFVTKDDSFIDESWLLALKKILTLIDEQSLGTSDEDKLGFVPYTFLRISNQATETTVHGRGSPSKKSGLVKSYFRPSDDACLLPFNIPGNAMLSVVLNKTALMLNSVNFAGKNITKHFVKNLANECEKKSERIRNAIFKHGLIKVKRNDKENDKIFDEIFAYEIDGFGSYYLMDDANIPSLLSLPFLGFIDKNDPIYLATRRHILSKKNPYFYKGKAGYGIGGAHNGDGWIWPMAIIVEALTTDDDVIIMNCLKRLVGTTAGLNFIHESFWRDDANKFTRPWFAWANTLFGELIVGLMRDKPYILNEFSLKE